MNYELSIEPFRFHEFFPRSSFGPEAEVGAKAAASRAYSGGKFGLSLDGKAAGFLHSAEGGHAKAEVVSVVTGASSFPEKHISAIKYEDIVLQMALPMEKGLGEWITDSLKAQVVSKNGTIQFLDSDNRERATREFERALISEISFPALDGSSKDAGFITVTLTPESTQYKKGSTGRVVKDQSGQKHWLPANFRLTIDGLDATRVSRIEPFAIRRKITTEAIGEKRNYRIMPATLEVPNLSVTLAESHADSWYQWFEDFAIQGNNDDSKERSGKLSLLTANLKSELASIDLLRLGIVQMARTKQEASQNIARVKAEMYCEEMKFNLLVSP